MTVNFNYDPWRGGFYLRFLNSGRAYVQSVFNDLMSIHFNNRDQIVAIESFFGDHGGVPLRGLHGSNNFPQGVFQIEGQQFRSGSFQLRQRKKKLEFWFSTGENVPRAHWAEQYDESIGIKAWFSSRKAKAGWPVPGVGEQIEIQMLAGLSVEFRRTTAKFPISKICIAVEDFK